MRRPPPRARSTPTVSYARQHQVADLAPDLHAADVGVTGRRLFPLGLGLGAEGAVKLHGLSPAGHYFTGCRPAAGMAACPFGKNTRTFPAISSTECSGHTSPGCASSAT